MKHKRGIRKGTVWSRWLLSYLFILALPVLFGCMIYLYSMATIRQEAEDIQYQSTIHSKVGMETLLENVSAMSATLLSNSSIRSIAVCPRETYTKEQRMILKDVKEMLIDYMVSNEMMEQVFLYMPKAGYVVNSQEVFFSENEEMFRYWMKMTKEEFYGMIEENLFNTLHITHSETGASRLVYTSCASQQKNYADQDMMIVVFLNTGKVKRLLASPQMATYLVDGAGNLFYASENFSVEKQIEEVQIGEEVQEEFYRFGQDYAIRLPLNLPGLSVLHIIPKNVFLEKLNRAKIILIGYIVLCLLLGFILADYLSIRNYSPVDRLLRLTQKTQFRSSQTEEFQAIQESIEKMMSQYEKNKQMERKIEFYHQSNNLFKLLR